MIFCKQMESHLNGDDSVIRFIPKFREVGIPVTDGGTSIILIKFCPWCGNQLPPSMRDQWFNKLEEMNLEPDSRLPSEMKSDLWWRKVEK